MSVLFSAERTYQGRWLIGMDGEKKSREFMLSGQLDDDEYKQSIYSNLIYENKR